MNGVGSEAMYRCSCATSFGGASVWRRRGSNGRGICAASPVPHAQIPYEVNDCSEHRALALQAARESVVLLKNEDGLLPLDVDIDRIAVIGPNADDLMVLLGNYNGTPSRAVTPLEGIRRRISPTTKLYYARGCEIADGVPPLGVIPPTCLAPEGDWRCPTHWALALVHLHAHCERRILPLGHGAQTFFLGQS